MSRYDGLIIPRSYSEYINKTDAATLSQALALPGVMDAAPTESSNKAARSGGIYNAIDAVKPVDTVALNNMHSVTSNAVSRAMSYSTSEVNTGKKWIDGKPIYKKSGYVSSISSVPYIVDSVLTDSYVDVLIESKASMKYYSSKVVVYGYSSTTDRFSLRATSSGLDLVTNFSLGDITEGFYWTVEYTKTTD